jgi:hypothetical protein
MSLVLRRRTDGTVGVVGDAPDTHTFATSFIQRALEAGYVRVTVEVATDDGGTVYELDAIGDEDGTPNATAWQCHKVDAEQKGH